MELNIQDFGRWQDVLDVDPDWWWFSPWMTPGIIWRCSDFMLEYCLVWIYWIYCCLLAKWKKKRKKLHLLYFSCFHTMMVRYHLTAICWFIKCVEFLLFRRCSFLFYEYNFGQVILPHPIGSSPQGCAPWSSYRAFLRSDCLRPFPPIIAQSDPTVRNAYIKALHLQLWFGH